MHFYRDHPEKLLRHLPSQLPAKALLSWPARVFFLQLNLPYERTVTRWITTDYMTGFWWGQILERDLRWREPTLTFSLGIPIRIKLDESRLKGKCIKSYRPSPDLRCVFLTLFTEFNRRKFWETTQLFDLRSQINEWNENWLEPFLENLLLVSFCIYNL